MENWKTLNCLGDSKRLNGIVCIIRYSGLDV